MQNTKCKLQNAKWSFAFCSLHFAVCIASSSPGGRFPSTIQQAEGNVAAVSSCGKVGFPHKITLDHGGGRPAWDLHVPRCTAASGIDLTTGVFHAKGPDFHDHGASAVRANPSD